MYVPEPGVRSHNYVSYFCSPFHVWFHHMGYPKLDVLQYEDGEWAIIQMYSAPVIPAETKWRRVLEGMQHVEISYGFIKKYVEQIDIERKAFWDREEAKSRAAEEDEVKTDLHREEMVDKAYMAIRQNPALMDRIARNGLYEMDPTQIWKNIPNHRL